MPHAKSYNKQQLQEMYHIIRSHLAKGGQNPTPQLLFHVFSVGVTFFPEWVQPPAIFP